MNSLFTYICEFRGGTYTTQVQSSNLKSSIKDWIEKIKDEQEQIDQLGSKTIEEIQGQLLKKKKLDENPIILNGLVNVWYLSISTKQGFGSINIIKTEKKYKTHNNKS
jgi:hypothetical protein